MEKQFKPKLRFSEFEDNWSKEKLSNLGIKVIDGDRGKNYPNGKDFTEEGFCLFLNAKNVTKKGFAFDDTSFISKEKDELLRKGKLKRNDIILTTRGSVGHIAFYDTNITYDHIRINSGMVLLRNVKKSIIDNRYFYKYLNSLQLQRYILKVAFGSAQPQLTVKEIYNFSLSFPNLPEQQKIASFLTDVDAKITKLTKKKNLLEQYKKGVMQKIFNQETDKVGSRTPKENKKGGEQLRFKDDNGNEFPKWEVKKLGDIVSINKGKQLNAEFLTDTGKYPCISGGVNPSGYTEDFNTDANTITISEGGNSCGYVNFFKTKFWCGGHCYAIKDLSKNVMNEFLFQLLKYYEIKIMSLRVGSGLPNIQKKDITNFKVLLPISIEEQTKIANFLSEIDVKIEALNTKIENSKSFKKGLLQQMFV